MIQPQRVQPLNDRPVRANRDFALYWMQQSQRARFNPALEHAIEQSNELRLPLLVAFGLTDDYPEANARHYAFMLDGLRDVARDLRERGIRFVVARGQPPLVALKFARRAALVVCDRGYLRHQERWRDHVADGATCRVVQVEGDVVVPVEVVSNKAEYAARTIRPKILRQLEPFLANLPEERVRRPSLRLHVENELDLSNTSAVLKKLKIDHSVAPSTRLKGGSTEAQRRLDQFIRHTLAEYGTARSDPGAQGTSMLAAYLHFGQISPVEIALRVRRAKAPQAARDAYLEELIVRRELAVNFVHFTPNYDRYDSLPAWARKSLARRACDERPAIYTRAQLERAQTRDPYWNAAQREMNLSGFMHNSMRMYWGKRILEWTRSPHAAYETTLYLNNKLFLCGRDPNAYANVGWVYGLHDRPWGPERPIFGLVRYMNAAGLERKFDMNAYVRFVEQLDRGRH